MLAPVLRGLVRLVERWRFVPLHGNVRLHANSTREITVTMDTWGIPHVHAATQADASLALGYLHARERLFQMDFMRHVVAGQVSELVGAIAVRTDEYIRALELGVRADVVWKAMGGKDRVIVDAYVRGVNAYLASEAYRKPIEHFILGMDTPRKWLPEDVVRVVLFQGWQMSKAHPPCTFSLISFMIHYRDGTLRLRGRP